jgi:hypothetical protein
MKTGKKDSRASMRKSVTGKSLINPAGRNPIKSANAYETPGEVNVARRKTGSEEGGTGTRSGGG